MRKLLCIALLAGTGCLRLSTSPFDTSQGGWLGALITALLAPTRTIVAVGAQGKAFTSTDGFTWTARSITTDTTLDFYSVTNTGSLFVAVGGNAANTQAVIFTSSDGVTWAQSLSVSGASTTRFFDVAAVSDKIVAVGSAAGSTSLIRTSSNGGISWTTGGGTAGILGRITHDGSNFMTAQTTGSAIQTYRSADGITFAATANRPFSSTGKTNLTGDLFAVGTQIIFAGQDDSAFSPPTRSSYTSNLGASAWTADSGASRIFGANIVPELPRALATNGSRLVAVGDACRVDFTDNISALTWSTSALTISGCSGTAWQGMIHDGSKFIAVGSGGKVAVSGSGGSTDWSISTIGSASINGIAR
jgi:hypothetical protein